MARAKRFLSFRKAISVYSEVMTATSSQEYVNICDLSFQADLQLALHHDDEF